MKGNKRLGNILWLAFERFGLVFVSALSFFTFAIYLSPTELGLAAIAIVFCELVTRFFSSLFENVLVRHNATNQEQMSTVFWFGGAISFISLTFIASLYFFIAPESSIPFMLFALSLSVLVSIFARPFISRLRCQRKFKQLAMRTIFGKMFGAIIGIAAAIKGAGEWSLVIQLIVMNSIALIVLLRGERSFLWVRPSFATLKSICLEGFPIASRQLLAGSSDKAIILILASVSSPAVVGYFSFARRLVELPREALKSAVASYSLPVFSSRIKSSFDMADFFVNLSIYTLYVTTPFFLFYGIFGEQLIVDIFGLKWAPATGYFVLFAFIAAFEIISIFIPALQAALGNSKIGFRPEVVKIVITLILAYWLGLHFGAFGVLVAVAFDIIMLVIIRLCSVKSFLNIDLKRFAGTVAIIFLVTLAIIVVFGYVIDVSAIAIYYNILLVLIACFTYVLFCKYALKITMMTVIKFLIDSK